MPTKPCIRCSGTGRKFGGKCYTCNGTGFTQPQARTQSSVEDILFDDGTVKDQETPTPAHGESHPDLPILKGRLDAAIHQIGANHTTLLTAITTAKQDFNKRLEMDRNAHALAISALEGRLDKQAKALEMAVELLKSVRPVEITIHRGDESWTLPQGHRHPQFETLLRCASSRQSDGYHPNIWVAGPAGSGKTTGGRMLAQALNLPFFFNGAVSMEHKLIGFRDAHGTYHSTPFREGYTKPAVYQFDDVDSSDNSALLALNAALANGECDFADRLLPRHPDSIILATANTWGLGATADYVGRVKIDAAFLSRFPIKIHWPYDEAFERNISTNPDWAKRVQRARHAAQAQGIKVIIDPRHTIAGAALIQSGFTEDQAAELTYLANLKPDERQKVEPKVLQ